MKRPQPPNNGKPDKTEPGAFRLNSNKKSDNQQQSKKRDETN
ncbi:hypothetical protein [Calothrix sp. NIES-2100]